ncbi:MAG: S8 family serine peptidase [Methanoregulaceae archaeon]|nr:S8 family serine peptidase [Methanoregulaceae archaeon]
MITTLLASVVMGGVALDAPEVIVKRTGVRTSLTLESGGLFHQTPNRVANVRIIQVPGSSALVITWNELKGRSTVPHYAVSLDGREVLRVSQGDTSLDLKYAKFDPLVAVPAVPHELTSDATNRMFIVQFEGQPLDEFRPLIEAAGGEITQYLPNNALLVTLPLGGEAKVRALEFVRWVGVYEPAYRIEPAALNLLTRGELGINDYYLQVAKPTAELKNSIATEIRRFGGRVIENPAAGSLMLVELTPDQVRQTAKINGVVYFDRRGEVGTDMDIVRNTSGANYIEGVAGYTGQGVIAHVIDSGIRATHNAFDTPTNRVTVRTNSTDTSHGTSCSGIVFGNGASNASGRGMLPDAAGVFTRYQTAGWTGRLAWTQDTVNTYNAVVESNSWGDPLTSQYTTISAQMDEIVFNTDLLICQSMSNAGSTQVRPQAWAKNIMSVGGIRHFNTATLTDDRWQSGASVGPAADGRIKPDLAFFYDSITTTSNGSDTSYTTSFGGTSAATPMTAGTFGILFQMWSNGIFGNPAVGSSVFANRPKSTMAKALMINQAQQYVPGANGNDITRMRQGWGLPWLQPIYDNRNDLFLINERDVLTNLQTKTYRIFVPAGSPALKSTMIYTDPAAAASANPTRINNLNLKVTAPNNDVYHGNVGLAAGVWSTTGGAPDNLNPTENIFIQNPASGVWTIEVSAASVVADARLETPGVNDVDYALVVYGGDAQAPMESFSVLNASPFTGTLDSLHRSDNGGLTIQEALSADFEGNLRSMVAATTVATTTSSELRIGFEARTSNITTGVARVSLFNNTTNQWEAVTANLALTTSDRTFDVVVSNGSRFINGSRQVRARVDLWDTDTSADVDWNPTIDQLRITQFQP